MAVDDQHKVLYIAHERKLGGASLSLVTMAEEMQKKGIGVAVVVPFYFSPLAKRLRSRGLRTYWVFNGWWMMPSYWSRLMKMLFRCLYLTEGISAKAIAGIAKRGGYQIIHSNSSTIDVGSRAAEIAGVHHVWHFREFGDLDYDLEFLKGKEKSLAEISQRRDYIIFISQCLKEHYPEVKWKDRVHVIYNGVDEKYLNIHKHENKGKIIFLISGNLNKNKRQDLVAKAAMELKKSCEGKFEIWIAGAANSTKNSKDFEKKLQNFISLNGLREVKLLGRIEDMNAVRRKADVEIVSSKMEAFGRVTVEAMLSANPVLASASGANPELIIEGKNGWLFESGNEESLVKKMRQIIENPEQIEGMGVFACQFAKERFLASQNTLSVEQLYLEIMIKK